MVKGSGVVALAKPALRHVFQSIIKSNPPTPAAIFEPSGEEHRPMSVRVLFVVHIYFPEYISRFMSSATHLARNNWSFIVTSSNKEILEIVSREVQKSGIPNVRTLYVRNRGRNFGPFVEALTPYFFGSDIIFHVHSKRSEHSNPISSQEWADNQWRLLFEDRNLVERVVSLLVSNPSIAIVYSCIESSLSPWTYGWGSNAKLAKPLLEKLGISFSAGQRFGFPAGGMFAIKSKDMHFLSELQLHLNDFPEEKGQLDGELQHALERLMGYVPLARGRQHGIYLSSSDSFTSDLSILTDRYGWGFLRHRFRG